MDYSTSVDYSTSTSASSVSPVVSILYLAAVIVMIVAMWKVFEKAGKPGWASLVPFYNIYVMLQIAGKPGWWLLLFLIPFANIFAAIMTYHGISTSFGKGAGFTAGLLFLPFIFWPMLAFTDAKYVGGTPAAPTAPTPPAAPAAS